MYRNIHLRIGVAALLVAVLATLVAPQAAQAVTRQEAVDLVTNMLIVGHPNEAHIVAYALHTPMVAGEIVAPGLEPSPGDTITFINDTWFIFIDDNSMDRWTHQVRYAFVDAGGNVMWVGALSWPQINGVDVWNTSDALTINAILNDEIVFGLQNLMLVPEPGPQSIGDEPVIDYGSTLSDFGYSAGALGANDGAIVCGGTNDARDNQGVDDMTNKLKGAPTEVPDANMHSKKNCTKQDFCDAIDSIATKPPLDKLYIAFIGHGGQDDGDGDWYLWFESGDGKLDGDELKEKLKKTKAKKICVVIEACYSGCLIPYLKGAADSIEIATAADKSSTSRSWTTTYYNDANGNGQRDSNEAVTRVEIANHYWDSFIGCLDSSRNWQQTHEWAVAQLDSADSAHQKPQYGGHGKTVTPVAGVNNIIIEDKTLWLDLPPSAPPQTIDIELITVDLVGGLGLPLFVDVGPGGAFPLVDPGFPMLGLDPFFGPPIFDNIFIDPSQIDGIPPDVWLYDLQSPMPPPLNPGFYPEFIQLPLIGLDPFPGQFTVDAAAPPQLLDPGFFPLPVIFSPGNFDVMVRGNQLPSLQQVVFIQPPDWTITGYTIPLFGYDPEGDPLTFILEVAPPLAHIVHGPGPNEAQLIIPPEPSLAGQELMLQGLILDPSSGGGKRVAQGVPPNQFTFFIQVPGGPCACPAQGDVAPLAGPGDGSIDVLDVVAGIDEVFRSGPPTFQDATCPNPRFDIAPLVTCGDGIKNVLDVVAEIDFVFRSGPPPCDPCFAPAGAVFPDVYAPGGGKDAIKSGVASDAAVGRLTGTVNGDRWTVTLEITAPSAWRAAQIEVKFDDAPGALEVEATRDADGLEPFWSVRGNELIVGLLDFHGETVIGGETRAVLRISGHGERPGLGFDEGLLVGESGAAMSLRAAGGATIAGTLPTDFGLGANYPNPFNAGTVIRYTLGTDSDVQLDIYNVLGRRVLRLVDHFQAAGMHEVAWDGRGDTGEPVASGMYFYRLTAGAFSEARKMMLLK